MATAGAAIPSEGRRHRRTPMDIPVKLAADWNGARVVYPARMLDASESGARLETDASPKSNQIIVLAPRKARTAGVVCRVVWVAEAGPRRQRQLGVNFFSEGSVDFWKG